MCGILGTINYKPLDYELECAIKKLENRGPDYFGKFEDFQNQVYLYHTRLAIVDHNPLSNQPFTDESRRYVLVYNGEIYNYSEIRKKLEYKYNFKTNSDTEVIFYSLIEYGMDALKLFNGMFALAFYNKIEKKIILARDSYGKKPLYYYLDEKNKKLIFSSLLSSLMEFEDIKRLSVDKNNVLDYLYLGFFGVEDTPLEKVYKLKPGYYMEIDIKNNLLVKYERYRDIWNEKVNLKVNFEDLLIDAIDNRLNADVEVGLFLSGGIDSTVLSVLASKLKRINTFSLGFEDKNYDESIYAERIAKYLNTNHLTVTIKENDILNYFFGFFEIFDEPFSDYAGVGFYVLSKEAEKQGLGVVLSGDGADELVGGYHRYILLNKIMKYPKLIRKAISLGKYFIKNERLELIENDTFENYLNIMSLVRPKLWKKVINEKRNKPKIFNEKNTLKYIDNPILFSKYFDRYNTLVYDYLVKIDRASMENSLEVRNPYLDDYIVKYVVSNKSLDMDTNKTVLRKILKKYLPLNLWQRPKQGFSIPYDKWFRNELFNDINSIWVKNLEKISFLNKNSSMEILKLHKKGKNFTRFIFGITSLLKWMEKYEKSI